MKIGRFYKDLAAVSLSLSVLAVQGAWAEAITKPMSWMPPSGEDPGPIAGTSAVLEKGPHGAAMAIKSSGLTPGHVVTVWWVVIQRPDLCTADPCSPEDAMATAEKVDAVTALAVGGVVDEDGTVSLASFLPVGEVKGNFHNTVFHSPETAEYHLPLQNHGPLNPEIADQMLTTFRAGCTDESLPSFYPETALQDGVRGNFNCKTLQGAFFLPNE